MEHFFKDRLKNEKERFLHDCFYTIERACQTQPHGLMVIGSHALKMNNNENGEYVPYLVKIGVDEPAIELYSDDGYTKMEDIAHWADVAFDFLQSKAAGLEKYSYYGMNNG